MESDRLLEGRLRPVLRKGLGMELQPGQPVYLSSTSPMKTTIQEVPCIKSLGPYCRCVTIFSLFPPGLGAKDLGIRNR